MMDRCWDGAGGEPGRFSLHAVTDEVRDETRAVEPEVGRWRELMAACRRYPGASNARRITFEYVMLKGRE